MARIKIKNTKLVETITKTIKLIGEYKNGNYVTKIYEDGTRIRETNEESFRPAFAENCDIKITNSCNMNCEYCHEGSNSQGKHGDLTNPLYLKSFHPYQELAIGGGNVFEHPQLITFLKSLKEQKVIANITVNQFHFLENYEIIKELQKENLIYGIGVSIISPNSELIDKMKVIKNVVCHVINGVLTKSVTEKLIDNNLRLLILGYKQLRRGIQYNEKHKEMIENNQKWLYENLEGLLKRFKLVSFDNLAIEQLNVKRLLNEKEWNEFYQGDDGTSTFYIDAVNQKFAQSSTAPFDKRFDIENLTVDEMFQKIRKE